MSDPNFKSIDELFPDEEPSPSPVKQNRQRSCRPSQSQPPSQQPRQVAKQKKQKKVRIEEPEYSDEDDFDDELDMQMHHGGDDEVEEKSLMQLLAHMATFLVLIFMLDFIAHSSTVKNFIMKNINDITNDGMQMSLICGGIVVFGVACYLSLQHYGVI